MIEGSTYRPTYKWQETSKLNEFATELQLAVEHILRSHQILSCFETAGLFGVRIEREGDLPLSIRRDGKNITVGRFFWRDGGECADPAVQLEVGKNGLWYPIHVEFADDFRSCIDGPHSLDFEERQKQVRFCARWSADLMSQSYDTGEVADLWGENI